MKTPRFYCGERTPDGVRVVVQDGNGHSWLLPIDQSLLIRAHSPTGFEWGYGGSGPAQLALALLLNATRNPAFALSAYQDFKFQVVGLMPKGGWTLTIQEIEMWLRRTDGERAQWDYFAQKWDGAREENLK